MTGPRSTTDWGSIGFPTIHTIDEVRDLEINIENSSELLDSGIRTEFTHITIIQHAEKRVPRKCQARNRPVSPIRFPPVFGDVVVSGYSQCILCEKHLVVAGRLLPCIRKFVKSFYPLWKERLLTRPYIALQPGRNLPTLDIRLSGVCMGMGRLFRSRKPFCGSGRSCEAIQR